MMKIFKKVLLFSIFFLTFSPSFAQIIDYSLPSVFVKEILVDSSDERGIEGRVIFISEDENPFYDFNYVITLYKGDYRDETFGPHPIILGRINGTNFNIRPGQEIEFNFEYKDNIIAEGKNTLLVTIYNRNNKFISQSFKAFEYTGPVLPYFKIGSQGANLSYLGGDNNPLLAGIVISENDADTLIISFEVDEFSEIHEARVKINTYRNNPPNLVSSFVSPESHMIGEGVSSISQQIKDPEISRPGSYLTNIYLINNDGVRISNIIEARYFLEGSTAEILRLISDKNRYNSGDTATVTVDFVGSFAEIVQVEEYINERILEVSLFDNDRLIETQQREIILGPAMKTEEFQFGINQDIENVILKASITRNDELLVNYSAGELVVEKNIVPTRDMSFLKIILILLLILIGIVVFYLIKKGKLKIKKTTIIILTVIILTSFSLINPSNVSASSSCTGCLDHSRCNNYGGRCGNIPSGACFGNWFPRSEVQGTTTVAWCLATSPACCTSCCQQLSVGSSFSRPLESVIYEVGTSIPVQTSITMAACDNANLRGTVTFTLSGRNTSITNPLSTTGAATTFSGNITAPSTPGTYTIQCNYTLTGTWTRSNGSSRTATRTGSCGEKSIQIGMRYHYCDLNESRCVQTSGLHLSQADCEAALAIHRTNQTTGTCWSNSNDCTNNCKTTLSVSRDGIGAGTITSNPSVINCGTTCSATYLRTASVTLTATPDTSSFFMGWDSCPGTPSNNQCQNISMTQNRSATARFGAIRNLTIDSSNVTGVSIGITPNDRGNSGGGSTRFTRRYNDGTNVTATAPLAHTSGTTRYRFTGWDGCTSTSGTTCNVTMNSDKTIRANYIAQRDLTVESLNITTGVLITEVIINNESTTFSRTYDNNTDVSFTAPLTHISEGIMYLFTGWSGCTSTSGTTCNVTMDSNKTIRANYIASYLLTIQVNSGYIGDVLLSGSGGNIWNGSQFVPISGTCANTTNPNNIRSCTYRITNDSSITLTATKDLEPRDSNDNYYFHQWSGQHCGTVTETCNNSLDQSRSFSLFSNRTVTANFRRRPSITNLVAQPYTSEDDLCNKNTAPVRLSWTYTNLHHDQIAKETQISINGIWRTIPLTSENCTRVSNGVYNCEWIIHLENFNSNHNWQVRSKNQDDAWSHTMTGPAFQTPLRHPDVDFAWLPTRPHVGEETTFLDRTNFHAFSGNRIYAWTFVVDSIPTTSTLQNPSRIVFQSEGTKNINLRVTGTSSIGTTVSCNRTKTVNVRPALPQWQEGDPFGFIKDIFAMNFSQRMAQLGLVF